MKNPYIHLKYKDLDIQVKMEDEGIVIDVFKDEEVVATTWKLFTEMEEE